MQTFVCCPKRTNLFPVRQSQTTMALSDPTETIHWALILGVSFSEDSATYATALVPCKWPERILSTFHSPSIGRQIMARPTSWEPVTRTCSGA